MPLIQKTPQMAKNTLEHLEYEDWTQVQENLEEVI
jgi:hypothetical protein